MTFLKKYPIVNKIIPGIAEVSPEDQNVFFYSPEGAELIRLVSNNHFDTSYAIGGIGDSYALRLKRPALDNKITDFQNKIESSESFLALKTAIIQRRLQCLWEYQSLSLEEQKILADTTYSIEFYQSQNIQAWMMAMQQDNAQHIINIRHQMDHKRNQLLRQARNQMGVILSRNIDPNTLYSLAKEIYLSKKDIKEKRNTIHQYMNLHSIWNQRVQPPTLSMSISYLAQHVDVSNIKRYMDRIGDAHTFYQFFGLSTGHGGWELNYLDLYNYNRNRESISSAKAVLYALISPLHAFFHEYVQIAQYEKNALSIMIRALIPILIIGLFLGGTLSLMAPLAVSELIEFLFFFPALYAAIGVASAYVELKNQAYADFITFWWGDIYQTPAFQVNPRLLRSFDDDLERAQSIADFYILSLKACDKKEQEYALIPKGTLTTNQLDDRKKNIIRKSTLLLEWYDIHSNDELGCDETPSIIKRRLHTDGLDERQQLIQNTTRYTDLFLGEVDTHLNEPARQTNPCLFFSLKNETRNVGQRCAEHEEKLARIESIYSQCRF